MKFACLDFINGPTNRISQCSLTVFLAQEVCFFAFSHGHQSLYQLLVRWTGGDSEPCSEHIPPTGPEVPSVVVFNLFQLCVVHSQLKAQVKPPNDLDQY